MHLQRWIQKHLENHGSFEADARQVKSAEGRLSDAAKNARKSITSTRKEQKEAEETIEGILYGTGIAD